MANLHPYLFFPGNCREAMTFYQSCLGGDLNVMAFGDAPGGDQMPAASRDSVMHAMLAAGGVVLMASDQTDGPVPQGGPVTLALVSADREEVRAAFDKLAAGGQVTQPLEEAFFGLYGALTDRFGINWMFQAGQGPS